MIAERCDQCGFEADDWNDSGAIGVIEALPARWVTAVAGLTSDQLHFRPVPDLWSIAEYADHVREVIFGMRFLLDAATATPGIDLGEAPASRFDPEPRLINIDVTLTGIASEVTALRHRLLDLPLAAWTSKAILDGSEVDAHWIVRHVVHDATHHLADVAYLRSVL